MGADLKVLAREAGMLAVSRIVGSNPDSSTVESMKYITHLLNKDNLEGLAVTESIVVKSVHAADGLLSDTSSRGIAVGMEDFLSAAKHVQPTAKREGFAVVPDVSWGKTTTWIA